MAKYHSYTAMPAGRYLKDRFDFDFTQDERAHIQAAQDALFSHAQAIEARRRVLPRTIHNLTRDLTTLLGALADGGKLQTPIIPRPRVDPIGAAQRIEDDERVLSDWVDAVRLLQQQ
jgi:hypothetical protein